MTGPPAPPTPPAPSGASEPAPPPAGRPKDYQLVLPEGWSRIDVRPGPRKRDIARLMDAQFRGIDAAPALRQQLQRKLLEMAQAAHASGGIEIYLCHQDILGVPVPASLVVSLTPDGRDGRAISPQQLAETFGAGQATLVELPSGTAVRTRRRTLPEPDDPTGNILPVTNLDLYVPVPASGRYLVLAFSTTLDALADAMVDLFDAIARTLRWAS
jgi:hypothetical protein